MQRQNEKTHYRQAFSFLVGVGTAKGKQMTQLLIFFTLILNTFIKMFTVWSNTGGQY